MDDHSSVNVRARLEHINPSVKVLLRSTLRRCMIPFSNIRDRKMEMMGIEEDEDAVMRGDEE